MLVVFSSVRSRRSGRLFGLVSGMESGGVEEFPTEDSEVNALVNVKRMVQSNT